MQLHSLRRDSRRLKELYQQASQLIGWLIDPLILVGCFFYVLSPVQSQHISPTP